jgi:uncharacterized protein
VTISAATTSERIDRLAATARPAGRSLMHQRWAHLLFLHWAVAADDLQSRLPDGLELDTFDGQAFVGLVPFTITGARPRSCPAIPGLSSFHEVNVRTYVHVRGGNPGVWFFSLDAANRLAVWGAQRVFHLPYFFARMRLTQEPAESGRAAELEYHSTRVSPGARVASCSLRYQPTGEPHAARPGTLEHFLMERYTLYSHDGHRLYRGRVHHAPYQLQAAELRALQENLVSAAGITPPAIAPMVHYSREVHTEIFGLEPVGP